MLRKTLRRIPSLSFPLAHLILIVFNARETLTQLFTRSENRYFVGTMNNSSVGCRCPFPLPSPPFPSLRCVGTQCIFRILNYPFIILSVSTRTSCLMALAFPLSRPTPSPRLLTIEHILLILVIIKLQGAYVCVYASNILTHILHGGPHLILI